MHADVCWDDCCAAETAEKGGYQGTGRRGESDYVAMEQNEGDCEGDESETAGILVTESVIGTGRPCGGYDDRDALFEVSL